MDDLDAMRKASRSMGSVSCAVCELDRDMTTEHRDTMRKAFATKGINSGGLLWWIREKYPECRLLGLKEPGQAIRRHKSSHR